MFERRWLSRINYSQSGKLSFNSKRKQLDLDKATTGLTADSIATGQSITGLTANTIVTGQSVGGFTTANTLGLTLLNSLGQSVGGLTTSNTFVLISIANSVAVLTTANTIGGWTISSRFNNFNWIDKVYLINTNTPMLALNKERDYTEREIL
ncbi:hypothetical protein DICPUDRAFT_151924 [Dictyostelium purpureum]|uniref:Uncharacterized protein n=1 Tax=Dictyostelium purpureum TaxID=5786 RepID=F0ZK34_DICPU|nr:uncharacterized protein DICPUDRAFT_151924 [Dictyostelium purpureum]EGC35706.1 hypothetical protein DICPUDRAFT_151924 [Dictyostelium purpureum]|eukprot:XP_003287762.1 hypothetical protein DICPUDRAFT_151924 [Dictyostelium purpureum]